MPLTDLEFEDECCRKCPHCYRARDMRKLGQLGHTLRWREDTREHVHDFANRTSLTHAYCQATLLRKERAI